MIQDKHHLNRIKSEVFWCNLMRVIGCAVIILFFLDVV